MERVRQKMRAERKRMSRKRESGIFIKWCEVGHVEKPGKGKEKRGKTN